MDAARYQRLRDLVHSAAAVSEAERPGWLAARCPDDPALVAEAIDLLSTRGPATRAVLAANASGGHAAPELAPGTRLGRYVLREELGRGGMGVVYEAEDAEDGSRLAVKVILPEALASPSARERFLREARLGLAVRHENVVAARELGEAEVAGRRLHFLAMDLVEGRTLRQVLAESGPVPEPLLREVALQAARGLAALHAAGVVHRDVKPENLLLTHDRRIRITDLGVAKVPGGAGSVTGEGSFVGSPAYAAPEQCANRPVGPPADLYSLGAVLYELASGRPPFDALDPIALLRSHAEVEPVPVGDRCPALSDFAAALVSTLLAKRPGDRFPSAEDLARALAEGEAGSWWTGRGRLARATRPRRPATAARGVLVGREAERDLLREAWREARAGRGGVVLVEGEEGIGKTRLVEELLSWVGEEDAVVLRTGFVPGSEPAGLGEAVAEHFGSDLVPTLDRRLSLPPEVSRPFAAWLRRAPVAGGSGLPPASAEALLARLVRSLAEESPVLWVVEDLHVADPASGRATAAVARVAGGGRLLLVATARPGLDPRTLSALSSSPAFRAIELRRLDERAVADLLSRSVGDATLGRRLARTIGPRADGVPLFALELLRDLERRGQLVRDAEGRLREGVGLGSTEPPRALRDLIRARVAALTEGDRAVLDLAAVEGVEFDPGLVALARGAPRLEVLEALGRLERAHGLVRSGPRLCRFDHPLVREILYRDLSPGWRAGLHDRLADALVTTHGEKGPGEVCVRIVLHRLHGATPALGRTDLGPALRHLAASGREAECLDLARAALAVPELLTPEARADVLLDAGRWAANLGRRTELASLAAEASALLAALGDEVRIARFELQRGYERLNSAAFEEALALGESAARRFAAHGDVHRRCDAIGVVGKALWLLGRMGEARSRQEERRELASRLESPVPRARATADLAIVLQEMGLLAEAEALQREAAAALVAGGDRQNGVVVLSDLGNTLSARGRIAEALATYEQVVATCRRAGLVDQEAVAHVNSGEVQLRVGRLDAAREELETALALTRETGARRVEAYALNGLGLLAWWSGDRVEARRRFEEAVRIRRSIDNRQALGETLLLLGALDLEEGAEADARARLEESLRLAESVGDPSGALLARLHLARITSGGLAAARAAFAAAESRLRVDALLEARQLLWRLSGDPADLLAAKAVLAEQSALVPPDARAAFVDRVPYARAVATAVTPLPSRL